MLGKYLNEQIIKEWIAQGHSLTGKFEETLEYVEKREGNRFIIEGWGKDYAKYVENFTPASRIPFKPGSGRKHSKFIEGLQRYAKLRFKLNEKNALSAAFAMAKVMKKYGKSTPGSKKYSKTGERHNFVDNTINRERPALSRMIEREYGRPEFAKFKNMLKKWQ